MHINNGMIIGILVCLMNTAVAAAQDEGPSGLRVQILDYQSVEGDDDFARGLSLAVRMAAMNRDGLAVAENSVTLAQMRLAHGCGDDPTPTADCYAQIAATMSTDIVITGVVQRSSEDPDSFEYLVLSEVFDARSGEIVGTLRSRFARAQGNAEIASQFSRVLGELLARIEGSADVPEVQLASREPSTRTQPGRDPFPQILGWTLVGGGAVAFGLMIGSWARLGDIQSDPDLQAYRERVPQNIRDACREAAAGRSYASGGVTAEEATRQMGRVRGLCDEGSTWEASQFVFLGAGIAFAGIGAALLVLDASSTQAPNVSIRPSVGPEHAYLELSGSF